MNWWNNFMLFLSACPHKWTLVERRELRLMGSEKSTIPDAYLHVFIERCENCGRHTVRKYRV